MLSRFDDYPIHQTPEPIAHRASSDESWMESDLQPGNPFHQHLHNLVRARVGTEPGVGLLEQILIGPHAGYGFQGLVDGAPVPGRAGGARA
jgi:hypothetical protein